MMYGVLTEYDPAIQTPSGVEFFPTREAAVARMATDAGSWHDWWAPMVGDELPAGAKVTVHVVNDGENGYGVIRYPDGSVQVDTFTLLYPSDNETDVTQCVQCGCANSLPPGYDPGGAHVVEPSEVAAFNGIVGAVDVPHPDGMNMLCRDCAPMVVTAHRIEATL